MTQYLKNRYSLINAAYVSYAFTHLINFMVIFVDLLIFDDFFNFAFSFAMRYHQATADLFQPQLLYLESEF